MKCSNNNTSQRFYPKKCPLSQHIVYMISTGYDATAAVQETIESVKSNSLPSPKQKYCVTCGGYFTPEGDRTTDDGSTEKDTIDVSGHK